MASDNGSSFAKIGFIVVLGVAAIVGTLVYIGGLRGKGAETLCETYYVKGVQGLAIGSAVNFRGVKIGEVRQISFVGNEYGIKKDADALRILIRMAISHKAMGFAPDIDPGVVQQNLKTAVDRGLMATVASSGITGLSHIELDFNTGRDLPRMAIGWIPSCVYIPPKPSLLESFSDSAVKVMNQINQMDLNAFWSNVNYSVERIAKATASLQLMLESRQSSVEKLCDDLNESVDSIKSLSSDLKRNPAMLLREVDRPALPETAEP